MLMQIPALKLSRARSTNTVNVFLVFANSVGALLYLWLASHGWRIPSEHGVVPVTGEPFVWALALPVPGIFLVIDAVWGVFLLRRYRGWKAMLWGLITASIWLIAVCVDFAHH